MLEKMETCHDCQKSLDQAEYDGQFCSTCKTRPFNFVKESERIDPTGNPAAVFRRILENSGHVLQPDEKANLDRWEKWLDEVVSSHDPEDDDGDCPTCGGDGYVDGTCTCGDDTCCCLEPEPEICDCQKVKR